MKILFLDIDGVLNTFDPERRKSIIEDRLVDKIVEIVKNTDCKIVLCSTWKISPHLMEYVEEKLVPKLPNDSFVGCTPTILPQVAREFEIDAWFKKNHDLEIESYVILDDYDFELPNYIKKNRCVITDALVGVTDENVKKCIEILNRKEN